MNKKELIKKATEQTVEQVEFTKKMSLAVIKELTKEELEQLVAINEVVLNVQKETKKDALLKMVKTGLCLMAEKNK